jgi:hypothetical protein
LSPLIERLGLTTLIITDLDAMSPTGASVPPARGKGQLTRNATLKQWHPQKNSLDVLLDATGDEKVKIYDNFFSVRVAYQFPLQVKLSEQPTSIEALPNTFEDALAYDNSRVFRNVTGDGAIGKFKDALEKGKTTEDLGQSMFGILDKLKKAEFALELLDLNEDPWPIVSPTYIREGLSWLQDQLRRKQDELSPPSLLPAAGPEVAQ